MASDLTGVRNLTVQDVDQTMFVSAMRTVASLVESREEFDEFMSAVAPEPYRCGYCDKWYVTPSLARSCEARHERTEG